MVPLHSVTWFGSYSNHTNKQFNDDVGIPRYDMVIINAASQRFKYGENCRCLP